MSEFVPATDIGHPNQGRIDLRVNDETKQLSDLSLMIHDVPGIVAHLSNFYHLQVGDVIYWTPEGVGPVKPGDRITGSIAGVGTIALTIRRAAIEPTPVPFRRLVNDVPERALPLSRLDETSFPRFAIDGFRAEAARFVRFARQVDVALPGRGINCVRNDVSEFIRPCAEGPSRKIANVQVFCAPHELGAQQLRRTWNRAAAFQG